MVALREIQDLLEGIRDPAAAVAALAEFSGTPEYNKTVLRILHCSVNLAASLQLEKPGFGRHLGVKAPRCKYTYVF